MIVVGIDTGGTFTDFVLLAEGVLRTHKVLSTPGAPEQAILQGIADLGLEGRDDLRVVHGTTVATNAVLEGKGARTAFITNYGLGDLLDIGRQAREALYDLQPPMPSAVVPSDLRIETGGRLGADGTVVEPLTAADIARLRETIARLAPESVAVVLLFSFLDGRFEDEIAAALPGELYISRSSEVLPEYGEFERGMATLLNARTGPVVARYLEAMTRGLRTRRVSVMQSSGVTVSAAQAARHAVRLLLSGPAGGLSGARVIAGAGGHARILTFDMGGTSTDAALVDGEPALTTEGRIGPFPVAVPMVDMHTIGAGGGSIARVDAGGMLQVGPQSAGADPGPACYGRGGREATVTDANLVLGRIVPDAFLGGRMVLDTTAAHAAVAAIAARIGRGIDETAAGIVRVVDEQMAQALRVISVRRGIDPRDFTLVSFGGAGGLHVCSLAGTMGMRRALVPAHAGVLSALGMLVSPPGRQLSLSIVRTLDATDEREIDAAWESLSRRGRADLAADGVRGTDAIEDRAVDLRYRGQTHSLELPWRGLASAEADFHALHEARYGHRLDLPVELVNLRVRLRGPRPRLEPDATTGHPQSPAGGRPVAPGGPPVWWRSELSPSTSIDGPAVILEDVSTTWVAPGWRCAPDAYGNLVLERIGAP